MSFSVTFLGTSSMTPTKDRGQTGIVIDCGKEKILLDCGENIQRQMRIVGIAPPKITRIFLTHWHGDHVFGLPGMLENIGKNSNHKEIHIYGPVEIKKKLKQLMDTFDLHKKLAVRFSPIEKNGVFLETEDHIFEAYALKHSAPCLGYSVSEKDKRVIDKTKLKKMKLPSGQYLTPLKEKKDVIYKGKKLSWKTLTSIKKGKKVGVLLDTAVCPTCLKVGKDADVLVCEATFSKDLVKEAKEYKHLTSEQAGDIAKKAKAKRLVITHFSQRYDNASVKKMQSEAKKAFGKKVELAEDFLTIEV